MEFSIEDIVEDLTDLDLAILQLLHAGNNDSLKGRVAYQKEMFLIADYIEKIREQAEFIPHTFGPYSEAAENEMGNLRSLGLVKEEGHEYKITSNGIAASARQNLRLMRTRSKQFRITRSFSMTCHVMKYSFSCMSHTRISLKNRQYTSR